MCGLTGFLNPAGLRGNCAEQSIAEMSARLTHRGPDDEGSWMDTDAGIALGHRRLKIIDLTAAGRQPMISASGRYVIAFNGEIYNHQQLRKKMSCRGVKPAWRGHSDTETALATIDELGVAGALKECVGMFAIALWDREERVLTLARDRMGEKPLYFGWQKGHFLFGSELSALRAHPAFQGDINREAVALYLQRGYIESPHSIYQDIYKLRPGTYLQLHSGDAIGSVPVATEYWSLQNVAEQGLAQPFAGDDNEAIAEFESLLGNAVSLQSIADVPLGAFLSGGVDSSTIVAFLQAQNERPVKSFTIGFNQTEYNEATHAKSVAKILGTDHTELYVTPRDAMDVIPSLPAVFDEPFGDSSAIPTLLVSQLARQSVTVSLSGDGGDELLGGYTRYQRTVDIWNKTRRLPAAVRAILAGGLSAVSMHGQNSKFSRRSARLAQYLDCQQIDQCYEIQTTQRNDIQDLVLGSQQTKLRSDLPEFLTVDDGTWHGMMFSDSMAYLPDDILAKVDRAAMSASLETRVPFLDHRLVEFVWTLPMHMKVREGQGKWLLKQVLRKHVPDNIIERPKMGFGVPVGQWIRGPLRDWAEDLLSPDRVRANGLLNATLVGKEWSQHLNGDSLSGDNIWQLLMLQAWQTHNANA